ncbi:MAG: hypothetical protein LBR00_02860 [Clostridiales Family XIII bacterium]|jgi:cell division protein FtsL|nr:hypothetical protein [Clostridiales Family XIII bacterium]
MASQTAEQFYNERQARRQERAQAASYAAARAAARAPYVSPSQAAYASSQAAYASQAVYGDAAYASSAAYAGAATASAPRADVHALPRLHALTGAEIRVICLILVIVSGIAFAMIQMAAAAAVTQQEINALKKNITQAEEDIVGLKVDIEQTQVIAQVREKAETELGMKEPTYDQYVYLADVPVPEAGFAEIIKGKAYGSYYGQAAQSTDAAPEQTDESGTQQPQ